jgi:hypothetical protein
MTKAEVAYRSVTAPYSLVSRSSRVCSGTSSIMFISRPMMLLRP